MKILIILFFIPFVSSGQYDTTWFKYYSNGVLNSRYTLSNYTRLADSTIGIFSTATRLKVKTDSLATALAATNAALLALKQNVITVLPFANGGVSGSAATSATTGTMTVPMTSSVITITPTGSCTFNASGGVAGQIVTFAITTSGTTSFVLTWGTNFRKVSTLATGTVSARFFSVTFICINGTIWQEIGRTAAQT